MSTHAPDWQFSSQGLQDSLEALSDAQLRQEATIYAIELESPYSPTHAAIVRRDLAMVRAEIQRRTRR